MIRPVRGFRHVYIYRKPVDFRKQVNGLSLLVQYALKHNPLSGDLFVFFNRQANKVRILYWEHNGFVLYSKYLEKDHFIVPTAEADELVVSGAQLNLLLDGIDLDLIQPHQPVHYDQAG